MKRFNIVLVVFSLIAYGCEDFLEKSPVNIITDDIVIKTPQDAETVLLGVYDALQGADAYGNQSIASLGVMSDELVHTGSFPTVAEYDNNAVLANNVTLQNLWGTYYSGLYIANVVIERIEGIAIEQSLKDQLVGEAKFLRALMHFDLVKLFGAIPYVTTTDLGVLRVIDRTSAEIVYANIITDLNECITLLDGVDHGNNNRANDWVAKALLARVQLYSGNKSAAGTLANDIIENGPYELETSYADVFVGGSKEVIFEFFSSPQDQNGLAFWFTTDGRYEYGPSPQLLAAFENGDEREEMIEDLGDGRFQAVKYKDVATGTDRPIVFRLAEMYLIRAEANIGSSTADDDVNIIRNRAGLGDISGVTLDDILQERFVELVFEGHRWNDLIRTNQVDAVMSVINPTSWQPTDKLMPIPQREIQQNPTLVGKQNPGY